MSTAKHGLAPDMAAAASATRDAIADRAEELRQLDFDDPLTAEELLQAKADAGRGAGALTIAAKARDNRAKGRPPGARNRASDELKEYLLQFGSDPLVGAMKLQAENPLVLAELWGCKVIEAVDRQLRARELIAPYMHGKRPVSVQVGFAGVADLIFEDGGDAAAGANDDVIDVEYTALPAPAGDRA